MANMNRYWKCTTAASFGEVVNVPFKVGKVYTEYVTDEGSMMTNDLGTTFTCDNGKSIVEGIQELQQDTIALQFERVDVTEGYLSEMYPDLNDGDYVLFKDEETMAQQFGYNNEGCIDIPFGYNKEGMEKLVGKVYKVISVANVYCIENNVVQDVMLKASTGPFRISNSMLINVTDKVKEGKIPQEMFYNEPSKYDHPIYANLHKFFAEGKESTIEGVAKTGALESVAFAILLKKMHETEECRMLIELCKSRAERYGENMIDVFTYDMVSMAGALIEVELQNMEAKDDE